MLDDAGGEDWKEKGEYFGYKLLANGNRRRLVDKKTGRILSEYKV